MIRIDEYELSGYKNIESAKLTFNNMNVIIGPNNSGKSNFIQSISFLNVIINSSADELSDQFKKGFWNTHFGDIVPKDPLMDKSSTKLEGAITFRLKLTNSTTNRQTEYHLVIGWKYKDFRVSYQITKESLTVKEIGIPGKATSIFDRNKDAVKYGAGFTKTSVLELIPESISVVRIIKLIANEKHEEYMDAVLSLNAVIKSPIFYFSNIELLKPNEKDRIHEFNGRTVAYDLEDEIMSIEENNVNWEIFKSVTANILNLSEVEIIRVPNFISSQKEPELKFFRFHHLGISKAIDMLSDGSILILAIITKILTSENDIIIIEEPENSTHPKALIDLFAFFKSYSIDKQFIISTHSIAILNKSKIDDVITSCVNENGKSQFFNISSRKDLKTRLKQGHIHFSDELFFGDLSENEIEFT